jgi:hypothetical protein
VTFYNVISGILFLGACKAFLAALGSWLMLPTALLALTILNESVITSELIERTDKPVEYSLGMKLLDFTTFLVLAWALLVVSPVKNAFDIDVSASLVGAGSPRAFWLLLSTYWVLMLLWNHVSGQLSSTSWHGWFKTWMKWMWAAPCVALILQWSAVDFVSNSLSILAAAFNVLLLLCYLVSKLFASTKQ